MDHSSDYIVGMPQRVSPVRTNRLSVHNESLTSLESQIESRRREIEERQREIEDLQRMLETDSKLNNSTTAITSKYVAQTSTSLQHPPDVEDTRVTVLVQ